MWQLSQFPQAGLRISISISVKGTSFFGDLVQANSVQHLATSSFIGPAQSRPRAQSSGLATSTRPGRSGEDTRPGMTSVSQGKDFVIVPVSRKSSKVNVTSIQSSSVNATSLPQQQSNPVAALEVSRDRVIPQSLFLTDTDPLLESPDLPYDPTTTNPLDTGETFNHSSNRPPGIST
jgi:hypothetical protein